MPCVWGYGFDGGEASQRATALCPEQIEASTRREPIAPDDPAQRHPSVAEDGPSWREIVAQVDVITELSDSYGHQQGKECPPLVVADPQPCDGFFVLVPRPAWLTCSQRVVVVLDLTGLGGPVFPEYVWSPVEYTDLQRFAEPYGRFWEVFTRGDTAPVAPQTRQQVTCGQTFQFRPSGCPPQWQPDIESALATRRAGHGV
eukprot:s2049_g6.t1